MTSKFRRIAVALLCCLVLWPGANDAHAKKKKKPTPSSAESGADQDGNPRTDAGKKNPDAGKGAGPAKAPPPPAAGTTAAWIRAHIHFDAFAFGGFSKPTITESVPAPTLLSWGLGGTAAYRLSGTDPAASDVVMFAGLTSDFRFIGQYSALDTRIGNSRGTRWTLLAPVVGAVIDGQYVVKADFQILGSYKLSNQSAEGAAFRYTGPFGGRLTALYRLDFLTHSERWFGGGQFEYVTYKTREITGVSTKSLDPALTVWQAGLTVAYVF